MCGIILLSKWNTLKRVIGETIATSLATEGFVKSSSTIGDSLKECCALLSSHFQIITPLPLFAIDNINLGSDTGSLQGADLLIAQKYEDGIPMLGKDLELDLNVQDKALRK